MQEVWNRVLILMKFFNKITFANCGLWTPNVRKNTLMARWPRQWQRWRPAEGRGSVSWCPTNPFWKIMEYKFSEKRWGWWDWTVTELYEMKSEKRRGSYLLIPAPMFHNKDKKGHYYNNIILWVWVWVFVKLRRGSGKDRQGMAPKAKGLKA